MLEPEQARARFAESGCVVVADLFARDFVERLRTAYFDRHGNWGDGDVRGRQYRVGERRVIHPIQLSAPFDETVYGNDSLLRLLAVFMEGPIVLNSASVVTAHPGAPPQRWHRDYELLFGPVAQSIEIPT